MRKFAAFLLVFSLGGAPLYAHPQSLLEAVGVAAASGAYSVQNTSTITTGILREDDARRSAIAFALSGAMAFVGAGLWRWLPCRETGPGDPQKVGGVAISGYNKCYDADGNRLGLDTPTKWLLGAGVGLELVSVFYLVRHLREGGDTDDDDGS